MSEALTRAIDETLGKTDAEVAFARRAKEKTAAGFARSWKTIVALSDRLHDGEDEFGRALYRRIGQRVGLRVRQSVMDDSPGSHFIAVTDCPWVYLRSEAHALGRDDVKRYVTAFDEMEEDEREIYADEVRELEQSE